MFDFIYKISLEIPTLRHNILHDRFLSGITHTTKIVSGKHFSCEYYYHTDALDDGFAIEGELCCSLLGRTYASNKYNSDFNKSEKQLCAKDLIILYREHGKDFIEYIKGIFLAVISDESSNTYLAYTSKSGLYRLYYAVDNNCLLISSSLSSIVNNLGNTPPLDEIALLQHGVFEHTLGERTFYQGIKVVDNYCYLEYDLQKVELRDYYDLKRYLHSPRKYNWKETRSLLPDIFNQTMDCILNGVDKFNSALTGGYDSRTILSYILSRKIDGYQLYTWAATKLWEEVVAANIIAKKLRLKHEFIELGERMLSSYDVNADKEVYWTDGSGSINRSNQMYSHSLLSHYSRDLITGYMGSELFRPLHRSNVMIRELFIDTLLSDNRENLLNKSFSCEKLTGFQEDFVLQHKDEFICNCLDYFNSLDISEHKHFNHLHYLIKMGFWKFYGQEFHSQRINKRMISPFIDDDFVAFILQTPIVGIHKGAYRRRGYLAFKGQAIYHVILKKNFPQLMEFQTDRGFAPKDYYSLFCPINVFIKHFLSFRRQRRSGIIGFSAKNWNRDTYANRRLLMAQKDEVFNSILPDDPSAGLWYSLKWYISQLKLSD